MVHSSVIGSLLAAAALVQPGQCTVLSRKDGCAALSKAGLGDRLLFPNDEGYAEREASYWAPNAAIGPSCILHAESTEDVSRGIRALASSGSDFAVRSGGHNQWAGGSNVEDGVTIDLGGMKDVTYDAETNVASIPPGPRWGDVFAYLDQFGVAPAGGRDANVGIGGFLTGGGYAYLTSRVGFGCDTVVNFEVVLADGSVINANLSENSDLFKALKGGWANFGIVTRFDVQTFPIGPVWGSNQIHDGTVGDQVAEALVKFTDENHNSPEAAHIVLRTYNTVAPQDIGMITVMVDTEGVEGAPIFKDIQSIPGETVSNQFTTLGDLGEQGVDPSDDRVHWFTLTFNNDATIVKKAMELHDEFVADLKKRLGTDSGFSTQCVLQPIPALFGEIGAAKGGNMLGLDAVDTNSILWLGTVAYQDPAHDKVAHKRLEHYHKKLEKFVRKQKGEVQWRYINYSDKTQNPLKAYGKENLAFMKKVAAKYDPKRVFQKQVPGSFKVSKA